MKYLGAVCRPARLLKPSNAGINRGLGPLKPVSGKAVGLSRQEGRECRAPIREAGT
jgi:hypothetical protein